MKMHAATPTTRAAAFTLVELIVSMGVLSLILVIGLQMINNVSSLSTRARARVETFQESRAAFESMTRKISEATLNTYWDYNYGNGTPQSYSRQSELHFISGRSKGSDSKESIMGTLPGLQTTTHSIFFQAPQGYSSPAPSAGPRKIAPNLSSLLNASGYFIEYATDLNERPNFLRGASNRLAERWRFRLMELEEPTENLEIYFNGRNTSKLKNWFLDPIARSLSISSPAAGPSPVRMLADNVIGLVVLPHRSPNDVLPTLVGVPQQLSPKYTYDSRRYLIAPSDPLGTLWQNQLPPLVQVTMIAIDEKSAARLQDQLADKSLLPDAELGLSSLFAAPSSDPAVKMTSNLLNDQYAADLATLEATLIRLRLSYRIFSTDVSILQAKWSDN